MAQRENERLQPFEKTLTNAVDFYVAHLESIQKSAPLPQAISELIENRRDEWSQQAILLRLEPAAR